MSPLKAPEKTQSPKEGREERRTDGGRGGLGPGPPRFMTDRHYCLRILILEN